MDTPEFLMEKSPEAIGDDVLAELKELIDRYQLFSKQVQINEETLKTSKEQLRRVSQEDIPNLLHKYGLSEIRLKTGEKVIVREKAAISIPADKEEVFFDFLRVRKEEDIIKLAFSFPRMEPERVKQLFYFLGENDYAYDVKRGVHPQTLAKYFRDLLGINAEDKEDGIKEGRYLKVESVSNIANVFVFHDTKVEEKK